MSQKIKGHRVEKTQDKIVVTNPSGFKKTFSTPSRTDEAAKWMSKWE